MTKQQEQAVPTAAYEFKCPICDEHLIHQGDISGDCINCEREFDREETVKELVRRKDHEQDKKQALKEQKELFEDAIKQELEQIRDVLLTVTDSGGETSDYKERLESGLNERINSLDIEELLEEVQQKE